MSYLKVNGIELYFEQCGAGPRLLFLNGSGRSIESTRLLLDVFAARFELLVHDQRGLGRSAVPPGPYTMADYAADALGLLDAVGWESAAVVGVSFGGMVAQELAVTAPDRVERLALVCTSAGGAGGPSYPLHELAVLPARERSARRPQLLDTRFDAAWLASHPADRALIEMMDREPSASPDALRGATEQLAARRDHDVWDRLTAIRCPTLVACGRYDGIAPPSNSAAIASRISGAELRTYEGGHPFYAQDPTALPAILGFLGPSD